MVRNSRLVGDFGEEMVDFLIFDLDLDFDFLGVKKEGMRDMSCILVVGSLMVAIIMFRKCGIRM